MLTAEATSLPSLVFEFLTDLRLMVSYQLEKVPLDAEWDTYLAAIKGANTPRSIVITEGGYPKPGATKADHRGHEMLPCSLPPPQYRNNARQTARLHV